MREGSFVRRRVSRENAALFAGRVLNCYWG
jgi:hypothetical protein